jgi:hypothetical protein
MVPTSEIFPLSPFLLLPVVPPIRLVSLYFPAFSKQARRGQRRADAGVSGFFFFVDMSLV